MSVSCETVQADLVDGDGEVGIGDCASANRGFMGPTIETHTGSIGYFLTIPFFRGDSHSITVKRKMNLLIRNLRCRNRPNCLRLKCIQLTWSCAIAATVRAFDFNVDASC